MRFRILSPAIREIREAAKFYQAAVPGLGFDFLAEIRAAIQRIESHPEAWSPMDPGFRRCRLHRFPYGVIYTMDVEEVLVVSVMDLRRKPDSWRKNLQE
jgi:toxin ParE2